MKKFYRIFLIAIISISLLLCSVIPVGAATAVQHKGSTWYEVDNFDQVLFALGDEARSFGYVHLPYSQNYFGDEPPASAHCILYPGGTNGGDGEILVPAGYYIDIDFQFYITYKTSSSSSWVVLPKKYISSNVAFNYDDSNGEYLVDYFNLDVTQSKGSDGRVYNFGTKLFLNNTGSDINVYSFTGGAPTFSDIPAAYAYYVQATRVRYRILSPDQIIVENQNANTDRIVSEIGNSANQITNGWTPDPQAPAGSGTVNDYSDLESGMIDNATDGVNQANDLFNSLGSKLEMYSGSFLAISRFIDVFTGDVPILGILLWVSLTIGLFGFIFNGIGALISRARKGKQRLFDFFDKIVGFFEQIFEMIVNLIEALITALTVAMNASSIGLTLVKFLPATLGAAVVVVTAISVVKLIAGR